MSVTDPLPSLDYGATVAPHAYDAPLHWLAVATAAVTFPLIFMGGLVTSHGAGMSVPDWPNSYGYNMFAFPFSQWLGPDKGGIFYEHAHRLMASFVGLLAICVMVTAWLRTRNSDIRWLATGVLGAVILQGVLGGLRVVLVDLNLAVVHACVAQAFFCLAALLALVTSRWWSVTSRATTDESADRPIVLLTGITTLTIYGQLILGALMRHNGAGLAIPDVPLAYGKLLPPISDVGLAAANKVRAWDYHLDPPVNLSQVWLHFGHRMGAVVVSIAVLTTVATVLWRFGKEKVLLRPAVTMSILLVAQVTLGLYTVIRQKPADIATLHVATGALLLVTSFTLTARAAKLYWPQVAKQPATRPAIAPDRAPELIAAG